MSDDNVIRLDDWRKRRGTTDAQVGATPAASAPVTAPTSSWFTITSSTCGAWQYGGRGNDAG